MVKVSVPLRIEVLSRKRAIFNVAAEFSQLVMGDRSLEKTFKKGILDREILSQISFQIRLEKNREICAEMTISIDWDLHQVALETDGDEIEIDPDRSVAEQLFKNAANIASLIEGYRKEYGAVFITTSFQYRLEIRQDETAHNEAREFLGHSSVSPEDRVWFEPEGSKRIVEIKVCPQKLKELKVSIRGVTKTP